MPGPSSINRLAPVRSIDETEVRRALTSLNRLGYSLDDFEFRETLIEGQDLAWTEVMRKSTRVERRYGPEVWAFDFERELQAGVFGQP